MQYPGSPTRWSSAGAGPLIVSVAAAPYHEGVGARLAARLQQAAPDAFAELPVRFAYLYGSQATGRPRPDSDVDIAVLADDDVPPSDYDRLAGQGADRLRDASRVGGLEVTVLNDAPVRFVGRVLRNRVVIFSRDEPARVRYESLLGRMSDDVEVWASRMDQDILAAIAEGNR